MIPSVCIAVQQPFWLKYLTEFYSGCFRNMEIQFHGLLYTQDDFADFDTSVAFGAWQWTDISHIRDTWPAWLDIVLCGGSLQDFAHSYARRVFCFRRGVLRCETQILEWWPADDATGGASQRYSWCWGYLEGSGVWALDWNVGLEQARIHAKRTMELIRLKRGALDFDSPIMPDSGSLVSKKVKWGPTLLLEIEKKTIGI